jgi:hypothetical protein
LLQGGEGCSGGVTKAYSQGVFQRTLYKQKESTYNEYEEKEKQMIDSMPCITCQNSLRDCGKVTPDWQWAYCTICGARYEVIAVLDEYGNFRTAPDGHKQFYLNPVKPGSAQFYKEPNESQQFVEDVDAITDFHKLKNTIRNVETVTDLLKSLKTL